MSCCNNHACGKQLYWFCNLSLFQVETIVQIGCLIAMVPDDVSTKEEFKTKIAVLHKKVNLCILVFRFLIIMYSCQMI